MSIDMDFEFAPDDVPPPIAQPNDGDQMMEDAGERGDDVMEEGGEEEPIEEEEEEMEEDEGPVTQEDAWAVIR